MKSLLERKKKINLIMIILSCIIVSEAVFFPNQMVNLMITVEKDFFRAMIPSHGITLDNLEDAIKKCDAVNMRDKCISENFEPNKQKVEAEYSSHNWAREVVTLISVLLLLVTVTWRNNRDKL
jgi:hypothetical protein